MWVTPLGPLRRATVTRLPIETDAAVNRWIPGTIAGLAVAVTAWSLVVPLEVPLRDDEITSLVRYSAVGPGAIWGTYTRNDHMLYELLTWGLRQVTGDRSVAVTRFWSVLPALAAVTLLTRWLWRRLDPWAAAIFAALACAAPVLTDLGDEGRGYGLTMLASAAMLVTSDRVARGGGRGAIWLWALAAVIGIWTVPVMALPVAILAGLLIAKRGPRRELCLAVGAVVCASLAWYVPFIWDITSGAGAGSGRELPWAGVVTGPLQDLLAPSVQALVDPLTAGAAHGFLSHVLSFHGTPSVASAELAAGIALAVGVVVLLRDVERFLAASLLLPASGTYLVLELARSHVINRFTSFLLPGLLVLIAAGLAGLGRRVARNPPLAGLALAVVVVGSVWAIGRGYRLGIFNGESSGVLVSNEPAAFGAFLNPRDITLATVPELQTLACDSPGSFLMLDDEDHPSSPPVAACLKQRHAFDLADLRLPLGRGSVPGALFVVPALAPSRSAAKAASIPAGS